MLAGMPYQRRNQEQPPVLGIDIGRVIISAVDPDGVHDTFLQGSDDEAMATPASDGAFDAIADLTAQFAGHVWLVSKCGPRIQARTRQWLAHHRFHERTAVPADHLRFCRKRPEKAEHCAAIGATHFIDDRLDVLQHLRGIVPNLYWFGQAHAAGHGRGWLVPVATWADANAAVAEWVRESEEIRAVRAR